MRKTVPNHNRETGLAVESLWAEMRATLEAMTAGPQVRPQLPQRLREVGLALTSQLVAHLRQIARCRICEASSSVNA